jgi:hypothetical protein
MILPRSFLVSAYNIRGNSTIAMIGDTSSDLGQLPPTQSNTSSSMQKTESSTISQIRSELDTVRNSLTNDINSFLHAISSPSASNSFHHSIYSAQPTSNPDPIPIRTLEKEHTRLAELLLQALLRLDAITTDGAWEDARRERKDAVREVQGLLDRLDGGWRGRAGVQIKLARK